MAPLRLRHPGGVVTIQVDFERFTVQDLQQEVLAVTNIPLALQEYKAGYPPHSLTVIPELPLESLGLKPGEQLIVSAKPGLQAQFSSTPTANIPTPATRYAPSPSQPPPAPASTSGPDYVEVEGGYLVHRIVPDDNACLFSSVALVFEQGIDKASDIRQIVADEIRADPINWDDAILGRPREEYIATILKPSSWGGAIELSVLAKHYATEIASVDVETGRIDHFTPPPEKDTGNRCILIYSGIHYDAATLAPMLDAPSDFHQTVMPVTSQGNNDPILVAAKKLADKLRAKRAFTNTATFDLKCEVCGQGLKGEKEARAHASETGHVKFGEY